ncbi:hypothetical protein GOBAR_DD29581 [Gossypium barbadense]|nr:hypothetical protein GOBAR_DD29581 [Gossypium barbadense]
MTWKTKIDNENNETPGRIKGGLKVTQWLEVCAMVEVEKGDQEKRRTVGWGGLQFQVGEEGDVKGMVVRAWLVERNGQGRDVGEKGRRESSRGYSTKVKEKRRTPMGNFSKGGSGDKG